MPSWHISHPPTAWLGDVQRAHASPRRMRGEKLIRNKLQDLNTLLAWLVGLRRVVRVCGARGLARQLLTPCAHLFIISTSAGAHHGAHVLPQPRGRYVFRVGGTGLATTRDSATDVHVHVMVLWSCIYWDRAVCGRP